MADPKRPTVEELREEWKYADSRPHLSTAGHENDGEDWRWCQLCALRAALDLLAEAQRENARLREHFEAATRQPAPEPLLGSGADLFDGTEDMGTPTR